MNVTSSTARRKPNNSVLIGNFYFSQVKGGEEKQACLCLQRATKEGGLHQRLNLHWASCKKEKKEKKHTKFLPPCKCVCVWGGNYIYTFIAELPE